MEVPEKYAHITKEIEMMNGLGRKKVIITTWVKRCLKILICSSASDKYEPGDTAIQNKTLKSNT